MLIDMKKVNLLFFCLSLALSAFSQFYINNAVSLDDQVGIDYVFIVNGIDASTELQYTEPYNNTVSWYEYSMTGDKFISNQGYISPDNNTGYKLVVDGDEANAIYVWVFDYQRYLPAFTELEQDVDNDSPCELTVFKSNPGAVPSMDYLSKTYEKKTVKREFTLTYNTKVYPEGGKDWNVEERMKTVVFNNDRIKLEEEEDLPLDPATGFTLSGDQFAIALGLKPVEFEASTDGFVFPVKSHLTSIMTVRDAENEISRPSEAEPTPPVKCSAPIEILFESRPSDPDNSLFDWKVYKGSELLLTRTDKDLRYTFEAFGTYKVKLSVYKEYDYPNGSVVCSMSDSVEVNVAESFLGVPNVFTPNGDGKNDEFRVAFRSLASFHCWVYNSWGKLVYEWTDPAKGWDGRVNGRKNAPSGTYFYIIKASGTDGVVHNKKGDISIIR